MKKFLNSTIHSSTVGKRIFLVITAVVLLMFSVAFRGVIGFYSDFLEESRWNEVSFHVEDRLSDLSDTKNNLQKEYEKVIRFTLLYKERNDEKILEIAQKARIAHSNYKTSFFQKMDRLLEHLSTQREFLKSTRSKASLQTLYANLKEYRENIFRNLENVEAIFLLVNQNRIEEAVLLEDSVHAEEISRDNFKPILANTQATFSQIKKDLAQKRVQVLVEMMILLIFGILVSVYLGLGLRKKIVTPLKNAAIAANEISEGNRDIQINYQYDIKEPKMLMASMKGMLDAIVKTEGLYNEEKNYTHSILESSPVPLLVLKEEFNVDFINNEFKEIFKCTNDVIGHHLFDIQNASWKESGLRELLEKVISARDDFNIRNHEWFFTTEENEKKIFLINIDKITRDKTKNTILLIAFVDISLRKKYEFEIIKAREEALQASQAKSLFISTMSHEIRTPLNAIIGMAEILANTELSSEQTRYVKIFQRAGETLLSVVNDVLDFSKIEKGELRIEWVSFSLLETIESACELMALKAYEKNVELVIDIDPEIPDLVLGDSSRIKQILLNLLSNAVKFTEKGEIKVTIKPEEGNSSLNSDFKNILFQVSDSGIGISFENQKCIFESFRQAENSTTRMYGGSGLGLAICKKIVEKMNGTISVESELGKGSTFNFVIPLKMIANKSLPIGDEKDSTLLKSKKILVFEENQTQRKVLAALLKRWGAEVSFFWDQDSVYDLIEQSKPPITYDFLLLAHSRIENFSKNWVEFLFKCGITSESKILILTSEDAKCGFKVIKNHESYYYLMKPLRQKELKNVFVKILNPKQKSEKMEYTELKTTFIKNNVHRILIVEDSKDNQLVLTSFLREYPFKISICENGEEALQKVQRFDFNLILMDVEMPVMDGKTATQKIKELVFKKKIKSLPIIALTAHAYDEEKTKIKKYGFDAVLSKPIKKVELLEEIFKYLSVDIQVPIISTAEEEMKHLVPQYVENRKKEASELERAYFANNYEFMSRVGHQLKGNAATYGFSELQDIGQKIEMYAHEKNKLKLGPLIEGFKNYIERIVLT